MMRAGCTPLPNRWLTTSVSFFYTLEQGNTEAVGGTRFDSTYTWIDSQGNVHQSFNPAGYWFYKKAFSPPPYEDFTVNVDDSEWWGWLGLLCEQMFILAYGQDANLQPVPVQAVFGDAVQKLRQGLA